MSEPQVNDPSIVAFSRYQSEPVPRYAIWVAIMIIIGALIGAWLIPSLAIKIIVMGSSSSPLLWVIIHTLRRQHGVTLYSDHLAIQRPLLGTMRKIDLATIQGVALDGEWLLIGYWVMPSRQALTTKTGKAPSLTDVYESEKSPIRKLAIIKRLETPQPFINALSPLVKPSILPDQMKRWGRAVRLRIRILWGITIMTSPLWIGATVRTLLSIIRIG